MTDWLTDWKMSRMCHWLTAIFFLSSALLRFICLHCHSQVDDNEDDDNDYHYRHLNLDETFPMEQGKIWWFMKRIVLIICNNFFIPEKKNKKKIKVHLICTECHIRPLPFTLWLCFFCITRRLLIYKYMRFYTTISLDLISLSISFVCNMHRTVKRSFVFLFIHS